MEYNNNLPIYLQVINQIKKDMIQGKLPMGEKLPSTRECGGNQNNEGRNGERIFGQLCAGNE